MTKPSVNSADPGVEGRPADEGGGLPTDRQTFVSLALQSIVNAFVYSTYLARLPDIRNHAGITIGTLGVVMTVGNLAGLLGTFLAPPVIARLGSRRVMIWSGTLYVFALPVIASSGSLPMLVGAIVLMMVMNVLVDVGVAMQSTQFSAGRSHPVMSRMSGLYSLGTVGGGLAASAIAAAGFDVTVHLWVLAAVLAAALLFVAPGLLPTDRRPVAAAVDEPRGRHRRLRPAIIVLGLASALAVPLDIVPGEWATFRMTDDLGTGTAAAAVAYFTFAVGMAIGRLSGDHAAVWIGRVRLSWLGPVVSAAGLTTAALVPSRAAAQAGFFVAGLGISVISPLLTEAASRIPGPPGSGFRALFIGNRLAGMLTPVAVGSLAGTSTLGVGTAMIIVVLPTTVALVVMAGLSLRRSVAAARPADG